MKFRFRIEAFVLVGGVGSLWKKPRVKFGVRYPSFLLLLFPRDGEVQDRKC